MTISELPAFNAIMNSISTVFITAGWLLVRRGHWRQHIACMITALLSSAAFLTGYLIYHANAGEKSSGYTGWTAAIYFPLLISHVLLAFLVLPFVVLTLIPAIRRRWEKHARLGRWAMPIWLYVSVTGVIVYLMLYRWFPPAVLR